jgi:folylpolyglutamate synthase/dihydropteroate synthase
VGVASPRALSPEELYRGLPAGAPPTTLHGSIGEGVRAAFDSGERLVVCGSFYLMQQAEEVL